MRKSLEDPVAGEVRGADPLPSWNDRPPKQAILAFVERVTNEGSADFVRPAERIATFDNDGTLLCELPVNAQVAFLVDRVKALLPQHAEWKHKKPYASLLKGDLKDVLAGGDPVVVKLIAETHAKMTTEEFEQTVNAWIATARHPKTGRLYTEMVYQPMLELLACLRANGFKTFIVSGSEIEFMRPWTERTYGIPPEQVVGSSGGLESGVRDGQRVVTKTPELGQMDDEEKPLGIQRHIGRRPIAAFGNSDGDLQMLEWTAAGCRPSFCLYVHHTDDAREYAYDRKSLVGRLDKGLDAAKKRGWTVASMKDDWKEIFP